MEKPASVDNNGLKKGPWSEEEDEKLRSYIQRYGIWNWRLMPKYAGLSRCGKSCRLRWVNYLKPGVKRGSFTKEEEDLIIELHAQLGNKWSTIASKLPGRTDNEIKNFWHTRFGKARRHNHPVPKETNTSHTTSETSYDDRELNEDKSQESTLCEMGQNESNSFDGPSSFFDTTPSIFSIAEPGPVDAWPDSFLADTATYGQNEFYPPLPGEDSFYPEFTYGGLSSLDETSYLSDQPHLWSEPLESNPWSSQTQSSYNYFTGEGMGGVSYDPSIEYFDHGDLFSSN